MTMTVAAPAIAGAILRSANEDAMTIREQFECAMAEWKAAVEQLDDALVDFMNDGLQTHGGTWLLTMSQVKGEALRVARHRVDAAKQALYRVVDDLQNEDGGR